MNCLKNGTALIIKLITRRAAACCRSDAGLKYAGFAGQETLIKARVSGSKQPLYKNGL